jgi:L-ascorbate metabolism protein UlaG (beta-lactamase superfamily)
VESWRPITPAFAKPRPNEWLDDQLTAAWLGHATVLLNFFGITLLTDPALLSRIGIPLPFTADWAEAAHEAGAQDEELPAIDLILLSHAHFDHIDWRTLRRFDGRTQVVTAPRTRDLLGWTRLRRLLNGAGAKRRKSRRQQGSLVVRAIPVNHWGARLQTDTYRGYNGYVLERNGRRVIFVGDTP